jgi:hypothetical protein
MTTARILPWMCVLVTGGVGMIEPATRASGKPTGSVYLLWSSMPDEELLALATQGKLSQPDALRKQVERLLTPPQ